ncbi:MAG: D-glycerate dehydrogenase [Patescibacteria group bacterium]
MSKNILITREIPQIGIDMLEAQGYNVTVCPGKAGDAPLPQKKFLSYLKKTPYDAVISLLTDKIDTKTLDVAPTVKIFANYAAGFNNIDLAETKKRGVIATNTPGVSSVAVAEHAVALMFALTTRLVEADLFTKKGKYKGWSPMSFIGSDITGTTIGLIGVGSIGYEVARMLARGFGVKIVYYDVVANTKLESEFSATRSDTVEGVLAQADIVSLHVPLLDSTHHLMNASRFAQMKPTAFLVNTSRGPVVDEKALVSALKKRQIAGAGLDVFEYEPKITSGLTKFPNVVLTPHIASARTSARNDMARIAVQNVIDVLEGREPKFRVNK